MIEKEAHREYEPVECGPLAPFRQLTTNYRQWTIKMDFRIHFLCRLIDFKSIFIITFILWVSLALPAFACNKALPAIEISVKGRDLFVEVAATPSARSCGLSRRDSLPEGNGMLFVFPTSRYANFWMKDTRIPLSIAFLDEDGHIVSIQKMTPMNMEKRYRSDQPVRYALEVNQGWFNQNGIHVGDRIELVLPAMLDIR